MRWTSRSSSWPRPHVHVPRPVDAPPQRRFPGSNNQELPARWPPTIPCSAATTARNAGAASRGGGMARPTPARGEASVAGRLPVLGHGVSVRGILSQGLENDRFQFAVQLSSDASRGDRVGVEHGLLRGEGSLEGQQLVPSSRPAPRRRSGRRRVCRPIAAPGPCTGPYRVGRASRSIGFPGPRMHRKGNGAGR